MGDGVAAFFDAGQITHFVGGVVVVGSEIGLEVGFEFALVGGLFERFFGCLVGLLTLLQLLEVGGVGAKIV